MNPPSFKKKFVSFIGYIGWKMFCWSYPGGERQYLCDVLDDAERQAKSERNQQNP